MGVRKPEAWAGLVLNSMVEEKFLGVQQRPDDVFPRLTFSIQRLSLFIAGAGGATVSGSLTATVGRGEVTVWDGATIGPALAGEGR